MPELVLTVETPNPLKHQMVFMEGKRHLLYVDEGMPDDGEPFIYLDPTHEEPHVRVRCKTYSYLDPPYYLIGAESGATFGTVQYLGRREEDDTAFGRPLNFRVTDLSDLAEYVWKHHWPHFPGRAAVISLGETVVGAASVGHSDSLIPGRNAELRLLYQHDPGEINTLLHISAFAFILTRYFTVIDR